MRRGLLRRLALVTLLTSLIFGVLTGVAYAGTAASAYGYYTVNGIQYENQAAINTIPSYYHESYGVTLVTPYSGGPAPTGWVGALPVTYKNGVLYCTGTWSYNSAPLANGAWLNPSGCFNYVADIWSSKGETRGWNGSGYGTWYTFMSPNQNS
jgi:hypothetical protein